MNKLATHSKTTGYASRMLGLTANLGEAATRGGLVIVLLWIGAMKFTGYEAEGISPFVKNSPLMNWIYHFLTVRSFSTALGVFEIAVAMGLIVGIFYPHVGVAAGLTAVAMFLGTLSFIVTTPGAFESTLGGFPALSALPGQFLIKDAVLAGAALWLAATSLKKVVAGSHDASDPAVRPTSSR